MCNRNQVKREVQREERESMGRSLRRKGGLRTLPGENYQLAFTVMGGSCLPGAAGVSRSKLHTVIVCRP